MLLQQIYYQKFHMGKHRTGVLPNHHKNLSSIRPVSIGTYAFNYLPSSLSVTYRSSRPNGLIPITPCLGRGHSSCSVSTELYDPPPETKAMIWKKLKFIILIYGVQVVPLCPPSLAPNQANRLTPALYWFGRSELWMNHQILESIVRAKVKTSMHFLGWVLSLDKERTFLPASGGNDKVFLIK